MAAGTRSAMNEQKSISPRMPVSLMALVRSTAKKTNTGIDELISNSIEWYREQPTRPINTAVFKHETKQRVRMTIPVAQITYLKEISISHKISINALLVDILPRFIEHLQDTCSKPPQLEMADTIDLDVMGYMAYNHRAALQAAVSLRIICSSTEQFKNHLHKALDPMCEGAGIKPEELWRLRDHVKEPPSSCRYCQDALFTGDWIGHIFVPLIEYAQKIGAYRAYYEISSEIRAVRNEYHPQIKSYGELNRVHINRRQRFMEELTTRRHEDDNTPDLSAAHPDQKFVENVRERGILYASNITTAVPPETREDNGKGYFIEESFQKAHPESILVQKYLAKEKPLFGPEEPKTEEERNQIAEEYVYRLYVEDEERLWSHFLACTAVAIREESKQGGKAAPGQKKTATDLISEETLYHPRTA